MNLAYIAVFFGGGLGSVARMMTSQFFAKNFDAGSFPVGTFAVNIIGAFLIGTLVEILALKTNISELARYFLVVGFLGGFTTFSAFSLEGYLLFTKGEYLTLCAYILASIFGTILMVGLATFLVRHIV